MECPTTSEIGLIKFKMNVFGTKFYFMIPIDTKILYLSGKKFLEDYDDFSFSTKT